MQGAGTYVGLVLMMATSCGSPALEPIPITISEAATVGCRSPAEPGCERCNERQGDSCTSRWFSGYDGYTGELWYNANGGCEVDAPPCAPCLLRDEDGLRKLAAEPSCDCEGVDTTWRDCMSASCECFCMVFVPLLEQCTE